MYASKVTKPQTKDHHRSHNESTIGSMLPRSISDKNWRPLSPERSLWPGGNAQAQIDETPAIRTASNLAASFCQVPVSLAPRPTSSSAVKGEDGGLTFH
jgi:hypothetical protein